ncbi:unnamed protein product [Plasmodium vivax]|uniref:(malaria parasite P. vivax) hypothetical protein n=1 Tax=Plasmodium vivax TaxID=5855 RepID=A0A8S4H6H6_PLAVI|nr:unnamed protein product [Plasmodium vivax]
MDINEIYPFLDNLVSAYKEFDKELEINDELYSFYDTEVTDVQGKKQKYKHIFLKLLKNLQNIANNGYIGSQAHEYCTYLYHWLYLNTKDYDDVDFLISIIFNVFETKKPPLKINKCPYNLYNEQKVIFKLKNIVKLSYFRFNYEKIIDILKKRENPNYCLCQKYLEECVNTYRTMKGSHCSKNQEVNNKELCSELTQFNANYYYLTRDLTISEEIPNIYTGERKIKLLNCPSNEDISELTSHDGTRSDSAASDVKTLPTALGTIAGATSVLALLYKFTPAGTFLHARIRGGEGRINNSDYADDVNKSVFGGVENSYDNSYNIGYETM